MTLIQYSSFGNNIRPYFAHLIRDKKKPLFLEVFFWFDRIKCFLVSTFSVKPLLHTKINYPIYFFSVERTNVMLLNCHMCQFSFKWFMGIKNTLNLEKRVFTDQKLVCEEFLIFLIYLKKVSNNYRITISFPKKKINIWKLIFNIYDCSACSDHLPTCRITFSCNSGSQRLSFVFLYNFRYLKFSN